MKSHINSWIWGGLASLGLAFSTITWVTILPFGGTDITVANVVRLVFIILLPLLIVFSRRATVIHLLFSLLLTWSLIILLAMALHGTLAGGTSIVRQHLSGALFGWSLALCIANSGMNVGRIALVAILILVPALEYSASLVGQSVVVGAIDFIQSGDRNYFIYQIMRPALNALTYTDEVTILASQINNLTSTMVLLACATFLSGGQGRQELIFTRLVATLTLILSFIIFSTSAVLVIVVFLITLLLVTSGRVTIQTWILGAIFFVSLGIILFDPLYQFVFLNIEGDEASQGARITQYEYAVGAINSRVVTGEGFSKPTGHNIHNWFLFSWTSGGLFAMVFVLMVYAVITAISFRLIRAAPRDLAVILALLTVFFVRTNVGGAGGIPAGSSILAAALLSGLLVRQERHMPQRLIGEAPSHVARQTG